MVNEQTIPNWLFEAAVIVPLEELVVENIRELVKKVCFAAKLNIVGEAVVNFFSPPANLQPKHCFTLLQAIAESHLAVHTWPELPAGDNSRGCFHIQLSSCRVFEAKSVYLAIGNVFTAYRISDARMENCPLAIAPSRISRTS